MSKVGGEGGAKRKKDLTSGCEEKRRKKGKIQILTVNGGRGVKGDEKRLENFFKNSWVKIIDTKKLATNLMFNGKRKDKPGAGENRKETKKMKGGDMMKKKRKKNT